MQDASIEWIAPALMDSFSGHIDKDTPIIDRYEPNCRPWISRAMVVTRLPNGGRCAVVDLLHPSEAHTMRCGISSCRCMQQS